MIQLPYKPYILVSYAYLSKPFLDMLMGYKGEYSLTIDSGAFTAYKMGKEIKLENYMEFLKNNPLSIDHYLNLDVIGDPERSKENYYTMKENGLDPMPVFTRGAPTKDLEEYYETADVVAIGGLVGTKGRLEYVKEAMRVVKDRKCHWLGVTDLDLIKTYKPYSCDSSSYSSAQRFGVASVYIGGGKFKMIEHGDLLNLKVLSKKIRGLGFNPADLLVKSAWKGPSVKNVSQSLTLASYLAYTKYVEESTATKYTVAISKLAHCSSYLKINREKNSSNFKWRVG